MRVVEFVIRVIVAALIVILVVEGHHVNNCLRVSLLLLLGDAVCLQRFLPLFGQALLERQPWTSSA